MSKSKITIIIPYFNSENTFPMCLKGLTDQVEKPYEIILVDNGSSDRSSIIAKRFQENTNMRVSCIQELQKGPSFARNAGAENARGDVLAFTDSDCIPDPSWIQKLIQNFRVPENSVIAGRIKGIEPKSIFDKFHYMFTLKSPPQPQRIKEFLLFKGGYPTANFSIRRELFETIGGFDNSMDIYSEDYDLCARIYQAGFDICYCPDVLVYHKHRNTLKGTWIQAFGFGKGHSALLKKHFTHLVIIDFPKYQYVSRNAPLVLWLHIASADKKLIGLLVMSVWWKPIAILLPIYLIYLFCDISKKLDNDKLEANFSEKWFLLGLLIFKSFALTSGRFIGSFKNKVLCI